MKNIYTFIAFFSFIKQCEFAVKIEDAGYLFLSDYKPIKS